MTDRNGQELMQTHSSFKRMWSCPQVEHLAHPKQYDDTQFQIQLKFAVPQQSERFLMQHSHKQMILPGIVTAK